MRDRSVWSRQLGRRGGEMENEGMGQELVHMLQLSSVDTMMAEMTIVSVPWNHAAVAVAVAH